MTELEFERLVRQHQGVVCAIAYAVLRDRARSEEVAQEAFLLAWQRLPMMRPPPAMPAWVCGVVRNLALNAARRRKEVPMKEGHQAIVHATPLDDMLDREIEALARAALGTLNQRDREVVSLHYRNDASVAEISAALGITEQAVRQRLHRGRKRLRSGLAAVEATLRATRPGPVFAAACVAALATRGTIAHAMPKAPIGLSTKAWLAIGGAVVITIATVVVVWEPDRATHLPRQAAGSAALLDDSAITSPRSTSPPAPAVQTGLRRLAAGERAELLDRIQDRRVARSESAAAGSAAEPSKVYDFSGQALDDATTARAPAHGTPLSKSALRYAIVEMRPLLAECYAAAYDHLPHQPGTLEVTLHLSGEPDFSTLVESVDLAGDRALSQDPELSECVRDTLFALELPAMTQGGTWLVHYPFTVAGTLHKSR
jgi:RNA polymerase sigma factor (sigma-70 family)